MCAHAAQFLQWAKLGVIGRKSRVRHGGLKIDLGEGACGVGCMYHFRLRFLPNLALHLAIYPAATVDVEDRGLVLHPSRPPVAPKQIAAAIQ